MNLTTKKIILSVVTLAGWIGVAVCLGRITGSSSFDSLLPWLFLLLFASVATAGLSFLSILKDPFIFALNAFGSPAVLSLVVGNPRVTLALMVLALGSIALYAFSRYISESINLRIVPVSYRQAGLPAVAFVVALTLLIFSALGPFSARGVSSSVVDVSWPYLGQVLSPFNSDITVDQYLINEFQDQGMQNPTTQMINEGRRQLSSQFDVDVYGTERMSDVGRSYVANQISVIFNDSSVNTILPVLVFLTLLVLVPLVKLVYALATLLLYYILKESNVISVEEVQIKAKKILI